jgi:hypothetical protein
MRAGLGFLLLWLCLGTSAFAENRVALVIGNSAYGTVGALPNPSGDAALMAEALTSDGFTVTLVQDAPREVMLKALRSFSDEADNADWALVYYAGHGIEVGGVNYLLPVDVELRDDRDAEDEAISLDRVLRAVANAHKLRLVILDACRNNPFAAKMKRSTYARSVVDRGLAPAEPQAGILVVYSAEAGHVAEDGASGHSPFTAALARRIQEPGLEISRLFNVVTADVLDATGERQRPYQYGSNPIREALYMKPPAQVLPAPTTSSVPDNTVNAIAAAIDAATMVDQLKPLIAILPEGPLKERVRARAEALKKSETVLAAERPATKIEDIEETASSHAAIAPLRGRAAMLVASADSPQKPVSSLGSTVWSLIPPAPGQPATVGVKAEADIPDLKMHAAMTLRKNADPTLQATHMIDLRFSFAEGAPITGFKDVGLPQMRKEDSTTAEALTSVKVKISDTYFLIALAKGEADIPRNLDLMQTRSWFDFPLLLNDDRIAKIVFQKSPEGRAMLEKAFEAWK